MDSVQKDPANYFNKFLIIEQMANQSLVENGIVLFMIIVCFVSRDTIVYLCYYIFVVVNHYSVDLLLYSFTSKVIST